MLLLTQVVSCSELTNKEPLKLQTKPVEKSDPTINEYFKILQLEGNKYPFKKLWGDKYSLTNHYVITSGYYGDKRFIDINPSPVNMIGYLVDNKLPTSNLLIICNDDWEVVQIQDFKHDILGNIYAKITIDYDENGNEVNRKEEKWNK